MTTELDAHPGRFRTTVLELARALWPTHRSTSWYVRLKAQADPVYAEALRRIPPAASLLDVGGGQGLLALLHARMHGGAQARTVLDWDERKTAAGETVARALGLAVDFRRGDVREADLPARDCVTCVDLLHYFPSDVQDRLLERLAAAVAPGGMMLIRDADGARGWRSLMTWLQEGFSLGVRITRAGGLHLRPAADVVARLGALGFDCAVEPNWGRTPFANVLFVARRR